jgi:2-amino-4-hydroxy-6-hydroxymethyldihydropteridine diphosphokinase
MVILGLGSNLGDRLGYLSLALARLSSFITDIKLSSILESAAMMPKNAPPDSAYPFLNMALCGNTTLTPMELFAQIKVIEKDLGRTMRFVWGPREIDIDILAMDDLVLQTELLLIPHKGMLLRDFVMLPVAQIAPHWVHPMTGKTAQQIVVDQDYALNTSLVDTGLSLHAC